MDIHNVDIYNVSGFAVFLAIELLMYRKFEPWVFSRLEAVTKAWRWLALAKVATGLALLVGLRHVADIGLLQVTLFWLAGGLVATLLQFINYRGVPGVDWYAVLVPTFTLASFFSAWGCLGLRATLATDIWGIVAAVGVAALAALASFVACILVTLVWDLSENPMTP